MSLTFQTIVRTVVAACCAAGFASSTFAQAAPRKPVAGDPAAGANAAVQVQGAWVRPSVPGQQGTGGYMKLTARENLRLVSASSPVAGIAEVHEMKMDGEVMRMRALKELDLPAGKTVELRPGGLHLMLMDLKQALPAGTSIPLTLVLQNRHGVESRVNTRMLVSPSGPAGGSAEDAHKH